MPQRFVLGPQRPDITLDLPFRDLETSRPIAVISAGWQEAENDIDDLRAIIGRKLFSKSTLFLLFIESAMLAIVGKYIFR